VFVNSLNPLLTSSDRGDLSSEASRSGFLGNSHAATIVALAAMSGPLIFGPVAATGSGAREHPAPPRSAPAIRKAAARARIVSGRICVDLMMERA
jgi:hypothetical protein